MLLTLLFHKIKPENTAVLEAKLAFLKKQYPLLLPGEHIPFFKTGIMLTFDDGYADFYFHLFPLLKKLQIKALLAVSPAYIQEKSSLPQNRRLLLLKNNQNLFRANKKEAFCSFQELKEMASSGLVEIASHSFSHLDLTNAKTNQELEREILFSKQLLEKKLDLTIKTFVYPYGSFNRSIHSYVKKHYSYILRIGSAANFSWHNLSGLLYRQNVLSFNHLKNVLKKRLYPFYISSCLFNSFRAR